MPEGAAEPLGYGLVIGTITYLSVVSRRARAQASGAENAEGIACTVAPLMAVLSKIAAPVVWLLDASTKLIFRLFGQITRIRQRRHRRGDQAHRGRGRDAPA